MKKLLCVLLCFTLIFPSFLYAFALDTDAASAAVLDVASGVLLYAKNENQRRSVASTTKIMSALITLEYGDLQKEYTVTAADAAVEGTALGIRKGDVLSVESLLYGLLLVSGNDAAHALANAVCGSQKAFVAKMNVKARSLGLKNTHFENPAGLSHSTHFSSALDMARLSAYALKNEQFQKICAMKDAVITFIKPHKQVSLHNHNRLLSTYPGCVGIKTGYTADAGRCLVSAAKKGGQTVVAVTLGDPNDWQDHKRMLDDAFARSKTLTFSLKDVRIPVVGSKHHFVAVTQTQLCVRVPSSIAKKVKTEIYAPHFLYAPVKKGQVVAQAVVMYRGKVICSVTLTAAKNTQRQISNKGLLKRLFHYGKFRSQTTKIYGG